MPLVPSYIEKLKNYVPGKPIEEVQRDLGLEDIDKLASNENPIGPSPKALIEIEKSLKKLHRYPDASGYNLRNKLAKAFNIKMENVILGAGSEGIMSTIIRTFLMGNDELISASNSFIGFRVLANASGKKVHWVPMKNYRYDLKSMLNELNNQTKIIYIANPDNPMGTYITKEEFDAFYSDIPERVLIILDEAYFEYAQSKENYPDSMNYRYDNVITLRTFSKAYGLAGLRIGYGFAHDRLINNLMKVKEPFEPSLIAMVAGIAAMGDKDFLHKTLMLNRVGYEFLESNLSKLNIITIPSVTNFITTVWESQKKANYITDALLQKGIIVRNLSPFGWANCIRISIGTEEQNNRLISELESIVNL
ncbi:MAG: histidinol-phosphate transaminase [Candidatus Marinimicrobia bacterium]|nr:histidinol-phosphate transaminase [Candidatus Neomarinimicrobiota bacterium]|tara:strand:+ start:2705 stop:3796 length:1092 start_codon:yes stop_codon:yes gene_type:complete